MNLRRSNAGQDRTWIGCDGAQLADPGRASDCSLQLAIAVFVVVVWRQDATRHDTTRHDTGGQEGVSARVAESLT